MKVLFLSAANNIHTIRWVNALIERGIEVILVSQKNHKNYNNDINKQIKILYLPFIRAKGYYLNSYFLNNIVKIENPDIINVHYASGYGTLGRFLRFKNKLLNVWGSDVYDFPNESRLKKKILIKNLKSYKALASSSRCMAKETKKYTDKEIYITPFGVDTNLFKNFNLRKDGNKIVIGIVKTLGENYGIQYLIRAIRILKNEISEEIFNKIEVHIYGKGSLENSLKNLAQNLGLGNKIKFLGYINNVEVPLAINKMHIFVVPSISESFGVAAVEAMACEIPVIVSDAEGLKEVVINEKTGFVVPKKNEKAIADKLKLLLEDENLGKKFGENARKHVLKLYSWENSVDIMIELYKKIAEI
ncbi:glycosyl transferase [Fusobacterium necrophorum BFTR-2]|uniref:Glycosyl transferase n=1 Tax=Fusobacterium necrophorum BL TaxID=1441732 RepID=A0AB73BT94_9FUSO|nr:glycosyltransferase [Fusobacterium necrophorum]KDE60814.1 glycosyl transferase [Fusobacterium necrophorum BL]KDE69201.1 glycosyl transferase [Fusobacterium necrophorum BFTR-2]